MAQSNTPFKDFSNKLKEIRKNSRPSDEEIEKINKVLDIQENNEVQIDSIIDNEPNKKIADSKDNMEYR